MPTINEAMDTDPCLIPPIEAFEGRLAEPATYLIRGTSLKVIERLQQLGWKRGEYTALSAGVCIEHKFVIDGIEDNGCCP